MANRTWFDDSSYEAWEASIMGHPILGDEFAKMAALGHALRMNPNKGSRDRRNWYGHYHQLVYGASRYSSEQVHRQFKQMAVRCRYEDQHLLDKYVAPFVRSLRGESSVMNTYDPIELLEIRATHAGGDPISRQARVEAIVRFIMARRLLHIDETESEIDVGEQEGRVIRDLTGRLFVAGASRDLLVRAILSRAKGYRIDSWRLVDSVTEPWSPREEEITKLMSSSAEGESPFVIKHERMPSRVAGFGDCTKLVLIGDRVKSDFGSGQKEIRKGRPMAQEIDKCGVHLVVYDEETLRLLMVAVERELARPPFKIIRTHENLDRDEPLKGVDHGSSNKEFKVVRYELEYDDSVSGLVLSVELNVQRVVDFLNDAVSLAPSRHEVFRYDQLRSSYFPFRYPGFLHGIDWREGSEYDRRLRAYLDKIHLSAILDDRRVVLP